MRKAVYTILVLVILLTGAMFVILNPNPVTLDLLIVQFDMSLAVVVILSVVVGIVLSMLFFSLKLIRFRTRNARLQRKVAQVEDEMAGIRQHIVEATH